MKNSRVFLAIAGLFLIMGNVFSQELDQDIRFFRIGTGGVAGTYYPIAGMISYA